MALPKVSSNQTGKVKILLDIDKVLTSEEMILVKDIQDKEEIEEEVAG